MCLRALLLSYETHSSLKERRSKAACYSLDRVILPQWLMPSLLFPPLPLLDCPLVQGHLRTGIFHSSLANSSFNFFRVSFPLHSYQVWEFRPEAHNAVRLQIVTPCCERFCNFFWIQFSVRNKWLDFRILNLERLRYVKASCEEWEVQPHECHELSRQIYKAWKNSRAQPGQTNPRSLWALPSDP